MPDYSTWPEKKLQPASLLLDPENPRIPPSRKPFSQREIIAELVAHDKVYDLAREIAHGGFDPVESLIGFDEDDGRTIILEGNRRLAALKLLRDPKLAPADDASRFERLASLPTAAVPSRIRVLLAPSREAAASLILRKHTREQIERWSPLQQARFYRRLVEATGSPDDVAKRYGLAPGEVQEFLRMDAMYELAQSVDMPADVRERVHDPRSFPASVLRRLLEVPSFREFLGVSFDDKGHVRSRATPTEFRAAYARVLTDIATEKQNTRTLNKHEHVESYVKSLHDVKPTKSSRSYSMTELAGSKPATNDDAEQQEPTKGSKRVVRSSGAIPPTVRCTIDDPRIREVFRELKRLRPAKFPNAHAVLQRILLEFGVSYYLAKTGAMAKMLERLKEKKGKEWSPTLTQMLREMLNRPELRLNPKQRKAVIALVNDDAKSPLSVETMDQFVHNEFVWPDEREIVRIWRLMEPLLVLVLREPDLEEKATK